jgi:hypothetical protein
LYVHLSADSRDSRLHIRDHLVLLPTKVLPLWGH